MSSSSLQDLLQRFPNFATQWRACQQKISKDGILASAVPVGADAKQKLAAANHRRLQAQTVLTALEQHVEETYTNGLTGELQSAASISNQASRPGASAEDVLKAIQVLKASQRLKLPPGLQSQAEAAPDPAAASSPHPQSGSLDHLLGVQPADLLASNLPDLHSIQAAVSALAPQVEARLVQEARRVAKALHEILPSADEEPDIGAALERKAGRVRGERREVGGAFAACLQAAGQQLQALQQHASALLELLASCKLQRQAHVDKVHAQYKLEHEKALSKKAEHAEAALLIQAYILPKGLLASLRHLASLVRAAHEEATASFNQLSQQLAAYQELGPEFEGLVREYRGVQEELQRANEHVQSMLDIQRELEAEARGGAGGRGG